MNEFDQFDVTPSSGASPAAPQVNPFDQFDAAPSNQAASKSAQQPESQFYHKLGNDEELSTFPNVQETGGILPIKTTYNPDGSVDSSRTDWSMPLKNMATGVGDLYQQAENKSTDTTPAAVNAMLNMGMTYPGIAKGAASLADATIGAAKEGAKGAAKSLITPAALPTATADAVNAAERSGVTVPNAALLNADSFAAKNTNIKGYKDYKDAVNKNAADLIGANDAKGMQHVTVNEPALVAARKNNGMAIQKVDNSIGDVPIDRKLDALTDLVKGGLPSDAPAWGKFATDFNSVMNEDGTIHASDVRDLTGYNSDLAKKARSGANDAPQAQKVIKLLKDSVNEAATSEQQASLFDVNNKYKLMSEFSDTGKKVGMGGKLEPTKIRDVLNSAYSDPNEVQYPARVLQDTLNTFHPVTGTESPLRGLSGEGKAAPSGGVTALQDLAIGTAMGHPFFGGLAAAIQKGAPAALKAAVSPVTNSQFYREALLRDATKESPTYTPAARQYATQPRALPAPNAPKLLAGPQGNDFISNGIGETSLVPRSELAASRAVEPNAGVTLGDDRGIPDPRAAKRQIDFRSQKVLNPENSQIPLSQVARNPKAAGIEPLEIDPVEDEYDEYNNRHGLKRGGAVNKQPTEKQIAAGNYKKSHLRIHGLDISIENPKGSVRTGTGKDGKEWKSPPMPASYGYIKQTLGADGDHVDCFIGDNAKSKRVYVIDQKNDSGSFDEHKVVFNATDRDEAVRLYKGSFSDKKNRIMKVTRLTIPEFKTWLKNGNTKQPMRKAA